MKSILLFFCLFLLSTSTPKIPEAVYEASLPDDQVLITVEDNLTRQDLRRLVFYKEQYFLLLDTVNDELLVNFDKALEENKKLTTDFNELLVAYNELREAYKTSTSIAWTSSIVALIELGVIIFK